MTMALMNPIHSLYRTASLLAVDCQLLHWFNYIFTPLIDFDGYSPHPHHRYLPSYIHLSPPLWSLIFVEQLPGALVRAGVVSSTAYSLLLRFFQSVNPPPSTQSVNSIYYNRHNLFLIHCPCLSRPPSLNLNRTR